MTRKDKDEPRLAVPDDEPEGPLLVAMNIARLRAQRGWSEQALAQRCGLAEAELAEILRGRTMPAIERLWKIAQALRVPVAVLLRPLRPGL